MVKAQLDCPRSKKERGLNEPAVRHVQLAQEVVVPQPVHTLDDSIPGIPPAAPADDGVPGIPPAAPLPLVPRVGSPVCRHPAYEQVEGPPRFEPVE